jgi:DNA-binding MarR family transcriptional regulator
MPVESDEADLVRTAIRDLYRHFQKRLQEQVETLGFTVPQIRVLREVVDHPGLSIKDVAQRLDLTQSTVSGVVERLIDKRTIEKRPHPEDRRAVQLWPTAAVARFMTVDRDEFVNRSVRAALRRLTRTERQQVVEALRLLRAQVDPEKS